MKLHYVLMGVQILLLIIMADILYTILKVVRQPSFMDLLERWANS